MHNTGRVSDSDEEWVAGWFDGERWDRDRVRTLFVRGKPRWRARSLVTCDITPKWHLPPPVDADDLRRMCARDDVVLPEDYRAWVLEVGDGARTPTMRLYSALHLPNRRRAQSTARKRLARRWADEVTTFACSDKDLNVWAAAEVCGIIDSPLDSFPTYGATMRPVFLVARPAGAWELWASSADGTRWYVANADRTTSVDLAPPAGIARAGFASWWSWWLEVAAGDPVNTVPMPLGGWRDPALQRVVHLAFDPSAHAGAELAELVDAGDHVGACALRALAAIDPASALPLARVSVGAITDELGEASLEVLSLYGEARDLALLHDLLDHVDVGLTRRESWKRSLLTLAPTMVRDRPEPQASQPHHEAASPDD